MRLFDCDANDEFGNPQMIADTRLDNPLKVKCHICGKELTYGELRVHWIKTVKEKPTCYPCKLQIIERVKNKLAINK